MAYGQTFKYNMPACCGQTHKQTRGGQTRWVVKSAQANAGQTRRGGRGYPYGAYTSSGFASCPSSAPVRARRQLSTAHAVAIYASSVPHMP
eukprot:2219885-Rhodomonas_salina.1